MNNLPPLVNYLINTPEVPLRPLSASLYEYILAGNGIFVRGARRELSAQFCVVPCQVRGLAELESQIRLGVPRVPAEQVSSMLDQARRARDAEGRPVEILFHLYADEARHWHVITPEQAQQTLCAKPMADGPASSYARALIEVHSHVDLPAWFSTLDDVDEIGFRLYAVLGRIFSAPEIRLRIGLYGYRWEIPATWVFELPDELIDGVEAERI